jgi:predicted unusual protein kinase regulating ubiquinone biosynthesis (AarF/ABC1/UbiB family)
VSQPLVPLVDEFAARLFAELDYVAEGHNAERFQVGSLTAAIKVSLVLWHSDGPGLCQSAHWPGRPVH